MSYDLTNTFSHLICNFVDNFDWNMYQHSCRTLGTFEASSQQIRQGVAANGRKNQSWLGRRLSMVRKVSCDDKYHVTLQLLRDIMTYKRKWKIWIIAGLNCLFLYGIYKLSFWQVDVPMRYLKGRYNLSCVKICIHIWLLIAGNPLDTLPCHQSQFISH